MSLKMENNNTKPSRSKRVLIVILLAYIASMSATTIWATAILKPCKDSFEGGCGYGQFWAGILSFFTAIISAALAVAIVSILKNHQSTKHKVVGAWLLLALPVGYLLYCLYMISTYNY
jgi:hypothetical protein